MSMTKIFNRFRKWLAQAIVAKAMLPNTRTHWAYPETQVTEDGSWAVRFYSYDPKPDPLIYMIDGKEGNREMASKVAYRTMRNHIDDYKRN